VFLLWPDSDADHGRKLLSDSIYRVNQALGGEAISRAGDDVRLNRAHLSSDVADFEAAVDAQDWQRAASLYAGPFLDGFFLPGAPEFDQWMESERAHHARTAARALEALAVEARNAGRLADAVEWWQRLAALAPEDSRVAVELVCALERAGNRAGALRHVAVHSLLLRERHGVEPDRSLVRVAEEIAERGDGARAEGHPDGSSRSSIAVLPFANLSDWDGNEHFAHGVSEEVMYLLTRMPGLRVASRTSAFAYRDLKYDAREVGRRLQVDWILEGSVRRGGETLRIVVQLTDARNGYQVWSQCFDRAASDVFGVQEEIATVIARRLAISMPGDVSERRRA
jgi:serine/threonine-protein kinase